MNKQDRAKILNVGVSRHKKPLQNIVYKIDIISPMQPTDNKYMFKDLGCLVLYWQYERDKNKYGVYNLHGYITPDELKRRLSKNQWSKFCQGTREFIVQRRIDGKNL